MGTYQNEKDDVKRINEETKRRAEEGRMKNNRDINPK